MAQIPVAEIPGLQPLPQPVMTEYPSMRVNYSGEAAALQQSQISPDAFMAPGRAMEGMGAAVSKVSGVFDELASRMMKSQNFADITKADNIMEQARADHAAEASTLPPDQRVPLWETKYRPKMEQDIKDLRLSPYAADQVMPQMATFDAKTRTNISYDAYQTKIADNANLFLGQFNKAVAAGDLSGAGSVASLMVGLGVITPSQSKTMVAEAGHTIRLTGQINFVKSDPFAAVEELTAAQKTGKTPHFADASPNELAAYLVSAKALVQTQQQTAAQAIDEGISQGKLPEKAILDMAEKVRLDKTTTDSLLASARPLTSTTPEDIANTLDAQNKFLTQIEGYDPRTDPDRKNLNDLLAAIRTDLPVGTREPLMAALRTRSDSGTPKPDDLSRARVFSNIDSMADRGIFGPAGKDADPVARQSAITRALELKEQFRQWHAANPGVTNDQIQAWFAGETRHDIAKAGYDLKPKTSNFLGNALDTYTDMLTPMGFVSVVNKAAAEAISHAAKGTPKSDKDRYRQTRENLK